MERVNKDILEKTKTLEELIDVIGTRTDGSIDIDIHSTRGFLNRYELFKQELKKELPKLSNEDILKIDEYFLKFKDVVYSWRGFNYLLICLQFEELKNKNNG